MNTYADDASYRTITAFYRDRSGAEEAVSEVIAAGIPRDYVRLVPGNEVPAAVGDTQKEGGFWEALSDFFFPDDDRSVYAEGLRRGGYLVTVNGVTESQHDEVIDILDDEGTVDIDEWSKSWRAEGWNPSNRAPADRVDSTVSTQNSEDSVAFASASLSTAGDYRSDDAATSSDSVIPVVQEQLRVGKRDINNGRVRVRSYVVETPVSETVSLRDVNVSVERRNVDRPLTDADAAFQDREIEAEEHREEAVVAKDARVREEVVVKKTASERTEQVDDTVRHTEVEIEDERAGRTQTRGGQSQGQSWSN